MANCWACIRSTALIRSGSDIASLRIWMALGMVKVLTFLGRGSQCPACFDGYIIERAVVLKSSIFWLMK